MAAGRSNWPTFMSACVHVYTLHALHDKLFSKFVIKLGDQCYRIRNVWHEVRRVKVDLYSSTSGDNANL